MEAFRKYLKVSQIQPHQRSLLGTTISLNKIPLEKREYKEVKKMLTQRTAQGERGLRIVYLYRNGSPQIVKIRDQTTSRDGGIGYILVRLLNSVMKY